MTKYKLYLELIAKIHHELGRYLHFTTKIMNLQSLLQL